MFCTTCGVSLAADAAFCQNCGHPAPRMVGSGAPGAIVSPHSGVGAIAYVSSVVYAGFWTRFAAYVIDRLILGVISGALLVPFFFLLGGAALLRGVPWEHLDRFDFPQWRGLIVVFLLLATGGMVLNWLYFAYLESGEGQATWGKQFMGLHVTNLEGNRLSFAQASGRFFAKIISGLLPFLLGYIMAAFTERRQALHDMIASTLVLRR